MRIANFAAAISNVFAFSNDSAAVTAKRNGSLKSCARPHTHEGLHLGYLGGILRRLRDVVRPDAALVPVAVPASTQGWQRGTCTTAQMRAGAMQNVAMRAVESVERS